MTFLEFFRIDGTSNVYESIPPAAKVESFSINVWGQLVRFTYRGDGRWPFFSAFSSRATGFFAQGEVRRLAVSTPPWTANIGDSWRTTATRKNHLITTPPLSPSAGDFTHHETKRKGGKEIYVIVVPATRFAFVRGNREIWWKNKCQYLIPFHKLAAPRSNSLSIADLLILHITRNAFRSNLGNKRSVERVSRVGKASW